MNRSFDIFRMGANGVDPDRGTGRADQTRARTNHPADPPFEHGVHHHPEGGWGHHAQQLERSSDYGYGNRERDLELARERDRYFDDRDRYRRGLERSEHWRHEADDRERARYHQGMYDMSSAQDMTGFPRTNYGNTAANEPYPVSRTHPNVWRGRNEDYDFWGQERHDAAYQAGHPSLWQRVKGAFSGRGPKNYVRSDERIHEDVCEHLTHHPYVDASDIEVTVRDGEVTLSGTVDARMVKRAAEEACDHVRGVKDVHNHLRVRPQETTPR